MDEDALPNVLTVEQCMQLLEFSDFYQLHSQRLWWLCEERVKRSLNKDNIVETLEMSDRLETKKIRQIALQFAVENFGTLYADPATLR